MNQWIADRSFGTGMALAFSGDVDFVRKSVNFAKNYLLTPRQKIKEQTQTFAVVLTTEENLRLALFNEAYLNKMLVLMHERPKKVIDWDSLPEDFDPSTIQFVDDPTEEMIAEANKYAREAMDAQMAALVGENFSDKIPDLDFSYALGSDDHGEISA